jgi:hypothetical protein
MYFLEQRVAEPRRAQLAHHAFLLAEPEALLLQRLGLRLVHFVRQFVVVVRFDDRQLLQLSRPLLP